MVRSIGAMNLICEIQEELNAARWHTALLAGSATAHARLLCRPSIRSMCISVFNSVRVVVGINFQAGWEPPSLTLYT